MNGTMKMSVLVDVKKAEIHEGRIPEIKSDEVLVQNKTCNICTADYQQWLGLRPQQHFNMAFGHENAGIVVEVGSDVKNINIGDHVAFGVLGCGECEDCRKGFNANFCNYRTSSYALKDAQGYYGPKGASEYKVSVPRVLFKMRKDLPSEEAGFLEPLATVVEGIQRLRVSPGEKVLVIGAGTMGILNAQVARLFGADVIISDPMENKLKTARELGFKHIINPTGDNFTGKINEFTDGKGLDAVVIAVGVTSAYKQAFDVAPKGCRFLIFAASFPAPTWELDPNKVHYKLWEIIGTYGASSKSYQMAADFLNSEQIATKPLIDAVYDIEQIQEAFSAAAKPGSYRVALRITK